MNLILTEVISSPIPDDSGFIRPSTQVNPLNGEAMAITHSKAKLKSPLSCSDQHSKLEKRSVSVFLRTKALLLLVCLCLLMMMTISFKNS